MTNKRTTRPRAIRVHTAGYTKDLYVDRVGGSCGDVHGEDCLVVHFGKDASWVISIRSLRAAISKARGRFFSEESGE